MINRVIRLVNIKQFDVFQEEIDLPLDKLLIKPDYLSICAADLRYYTGQRNHKVLMRKLPLSLIHEATGTVLLDSENKIGAGKKVILIPNTNITADNTIKGNYQTGSKFRSSDIDGFMQDFIIADYDRVIEIENQEDDADVYVLSELLSIAVNAVENYKLHQNGPCRKIGVWGDGSLGFVTVMALRDMFPDAEIYVFGHNSRKSLHFMMADKIFDTEENINEELGLDCTFECVGGRNSGYALNQSIDLVRPQGCISLLGVSEDPVSINTRKVLEKGITLLGNSRSERSDFEKAVKIIDKSERTKTYFRTIISEKKRVSSLEDIYAAFENAQINDFKTIMKWSV